MPQFLENNVFVTIYLHVIESGHPAQKSASVFPLTHAPFVGHRIGLFGPSLGLQP